MNKVPVTLIKQMGITRDEFLRLLPRALGSDAYEINGSQIRFVVTDGKSLEIALGPEGIRQIALMVMPTMQVSLMFNGFEQAESEALLQRFDRAYQRGGG